MEFFETILFHVVIIIVFILLGILIYRIRKNKKERLF